MGNWLFLKQRTGDGGSLLSLMNPFSKDVMQLPDVDTVLGLCIPCAGL
jgi:hypothetical protein